MSVDVTNPDAMPVRVRPRPRGDQSAISFHAPPTLLRVPDIRPPSSIAASEVEASRVDSVVATAQYEALADNLGEACIETSVTAHDLDASNDTADGQRESEADTDISTLAKMTGKTIDAVSRFAQKWTSQLGTFGAIAAAVIACMLVARAMKQDGLDTRPVPELRTKAERTAAGASADQTDIEVTNLDVQDDRIASGRTASAAGADTESVSGMSHSTQEIVHADNSYAHSPPFSGASGPTQNNHYPLAQMHAAAGSTPPIDATQPGAATNVVDPHATDPRHWASLPTFPAEPHTRFTLNRPLPPSPFNSAASPITSERFPNVTSVEPSDVWPKQIVRDDAHTVMQRSALHADVNSDSTLASSPQSPNGYPITDQSRYGSFDDLKSALIERKLERDRELRLGDSRPRIPTRNPGGAAGNLGTEPTYHRSGAYR